MQEYKKLKSEFKFKNKRGVLGIKSKTCFFVCLYLSDEMKQNNQR